MKKNIKTKIKYREFYELLGSFRGERYLDTLSSPRLTWWGFPEQINFLSDDEIIKYIAKHFDYDRYESTKIKSRYFKKALYIQVKSISKYIDREDCPVDKWFVVV